MALKHVSHFRDRFKLVEEITLAHPRAFTQVFQTITQWNSEQHGKLT